MWNGRNGRHGLYGLLIGIALVCSCAPAPMRPGKGVAVSSTGARAEIVQAENPKQSSEQTTVVEKVVERGAPSPRPSPPMGAREKSGEYEQLVAAIAAAQPMREVTRETTTMRLGASYEDTSRSFGQKLKAMYPLMVVALGCFVFAGVMVYFQHYHLAIIGGAGGMVCLVLFKVFTEVSGWQALLVLGGVALVGALVWAVHNHALVKANE